MSLINPCATLNKCRNAVKNCQVSDVVSAIVAVGLLSSALCERNWLPRTHHGVRCTLEFLLHTGHCQSQFVFLHYSYCGFCVVAFVFSGAPVLPFVEQVEQVFLWTMCLIFHSTISVKETEITNRNHWPPRHCRLTERTVLPSSVITTDVSALVI